MANPRLIGQFKANLTDIINKHGIENESNTPDYILAKYLYNCLQAFEIATQERDKWYGIAPIPGDSHRRQ